MIPNQITIENNQPDPYSTPATYKVRVGDKVLTITNPEPSVRELLAKAGYDPDVFYALQHLTDEPSVILHPDDNIDAALPGLEWLEPVSREGRYLTRINNVRHVFRHAVVTGEEILLADGKSSADFKLVQVLVSGAGKFVEPEDKVDLSREGIERFITAPHSEEPECVTDIRVTIITPIGDWSTSFPKATLVSAVITATLKEFPKLDATKTYDLRLRPSDDVLSPGDTLAASGVRDGAELKLLRAEDGGGQ